MTKPERTDAMSREEEKAQEIDKTLKAADKARQDAAEAADKDFGSKLDKVLTAIDSICTQLAKHDEMLGAHEKRFDSDTAEKDVDEDDPYRRPVEAKQVSADSTWSSRYEQQRERESALLHAQARADAVAMAWGEQAPPAMSGENVRAYRERLLSRFQRHSADYREIDLAMIADAKLFDLAETKIYADALEASKTPNVATDELRCITKHMESGHVVKEYHGSPSSWMNAFAGPVRQYVSKFHTSER